MADREDYHLIEEVEEDGDGMDWIFTYSDIVTLLFAFFVLLFSMSKLDVSRFTDSFTSIKQALGTQEGVLIESVQDPDGAILETVRLQMQIMQEQRQVFSEIRTFLNRKGVEGQVGAIFDEGIITLRVPSDLLFAKDAVEVNPEARTLISEMKDLFNQHVDQMINIKGYTDDTQPAPESRFKDNWEISAMRAVNVLRLLMEQGTDPARMTATGLADMDPILPNSNERNRAKNRRVEFVLEKRVGR